MNQDPKHNPASETKPVDEQYRVLVIDDEPSICWAFETLFASQGHQVVTASSAEEGFQLACQTPPDLVLLDVRLPGQSGLELLPKLKQQIGNCPVIVMTAFGDLETAVAAVKRGATDYLTKPFELQQVKQVCDAALRSSFDAELKKPTIDRSQRGKLIGQSAAMQQVFRQIALVAQSDLSVLITGETGTGKELVASAIHLHSHRAQAPYLPIAPVALNPELIESELFGHIRGAFTGAETDRVGLFEMAHGGTVMLDEIGDLPMNIQVKLLRVLEHGEFMRVGDTETRHADVRVLAATNCDLRKAMAEGKFREDLYYRLSGLQIHLPPLRGRKDDLNMLARHFFSQVSQADPQQAMDDDLCSQLAERNWQGNIRELRNAVEHAAVVSRGRTMTLQDFPDPMDETIGDEETSGTLDDVVNQWIDSLLADDETADLQSQLIRRFEPLLIKKVLISTKGNRAAAAERLGIHRGTLREKLRSYQMDND
ncbi:Nitrogen regulation protein NR(I) [Stieleria bergensis]|uniref:DNA-binding transcriptional regulator NtrC n=1 Tax=Stieleria bergensis TaxID=2528025 RepID=A0A517T0U6_9BACT|nr:Nitrogen regulation protein NR(I) [Planctomycetes bacterium SV_7m_r]